jgi:glycosyltransferase involved in cell wall biosynthesis
MQHGTPVVWTNTGGVPDVIDTTVWSIAKPKDSQDLREKIIYELSIKRDSKIIKQNTYKYDWSNIAKDILNTYTS